MNKCLICGKEMNEKEKCHCFIPYSFGLPKSVSSISLCKSCFDFIVEDDELVNKIDERTCTKSFSNIELEYAEAVLNGKAYKGT